MLLKISTKHDFPSWLKTVTEKGAVALIDKEKGWTSFDVIAKLRPRLKIKKIGHAGTLDPFATGLLILCFGKATKTVSEFQDLKKISPAVVELDLADLEILLVDPGHLSRITRVLITWLPLDDVAHEVTAGLLAHKRVVELVEFDRGEVLERKLRTDERPRLVC